jgi:hypothetical protein
VSTKRFLAGTLVLFTVLTAVMTYPQVFRMMDGIHDPGDPLLNTWVLSWIAHQLPHAPARLFDTNMFYPERNTLAYSELLLVPGIVMAPLFWIGAAPILIYNLVFLSGFALSGVGVALLVRRLTGHNGAAILGGIVFAFAPYRIDHYAHLQLQQTQFIPLALWAFHRLLDRGTIRDGALFGALVTGQLVTCLYYGLFLIPYLMVVCGTMFIARWKVAPQRLAALATAAAIVLVATLPIARAYLSARKVVGERGIGEVAAGSATWRNYLAPSEDNALYGVVFAPFMDPERRLFPGFVAVALAVVALWPPISVPRLAYGLGLLLAFDLSLGLNGLLYGVLYEHALPFRALRIPARMGIMVSFSLAVLVGYAAARIAGWIRAPRARVAALGLIGALLLAEYASKPLKLWSAPRVPPQAYADIMRDAGGEDAPTSVLFEFPTGSLEDPVYLYYSTFHWQYLVNGYSGFSPPSYRSVFNAMQTFPDDGSIGSMREHHTRYLVVHGEFLYGARYELLAAELDRRPDLTLISRHPWQIEDKHSEISVYRVAYP